MFVKIIFHGNWPLPVVRRAAVFLMEQVKEQTLPLLRCPEKNMAHYNNREGTDSEKSLCLNSPHKVTKNF